MKPVQQDQYHSSKDIEYARLVGILEGTRAGTWEWNVQTGETRFNERWAEIVGYSLAELQPVSIDTWVRLTHPDDLAQSNEALKRHFDGETTSYECDARMKHKAGHWVWVQDRGKVISRTPDGQPRWMAGAHLEITQDKELQEIKNRALQQLQAIARNISGVLYQFVLRPDGSAYYAYVSDHLFDVFGCDPVVARKDASDVMRTIHPGDVAVVSAAIKTSAEQLTEFHQEFRINHPQKGVRWIEAKSMPSAESNGEIIWYGYSCDNTEEHDNDERLRVAANVFTHSSEAILITDSKLCIMDGNQASVRITGFPIGELYGKKPDSLLLDSAQSENFASSVDELKRHGHWKGELLCRHKDGAAYVALASISAVRNSAQAVSHYVAILSDISSIKQTQAELTQYANYDVLTGLPNRRLLTDRLIQALRHAQRTDGQLVVGMLDIDGFKQVNDTYGHEAGDVLLREVAQRLKKILRSDDTVARFGGDEFVFVLSEVDGAIVFERILKLLAEPVQVAVNAMVQVTASMGITYLHARQVDGDALLREADQALYKAKKAGKNRLEIFRRSQ